MTKPETEWVRFERTFDAPIETIWKLWTDPDLFKKWYGPNGMRVPVAELDVVKGGQRKVCMERATPERTMAMWFIGKFTDVNAPKRLAYTESMCDAEGNILSPQAMGMPEGIPDTTEVIIELSEVDGKTVMTLTHTGVPKDSGGAGGWAQAIEKMAALTRDLS